MNIEEIKNKLEELQKDPKASELIEGHDKTDKAEAIADVAQKLGYDLKVVDLVIKMTPIRIVWGDYDKTIIIKSR